MYMMKTKKTIHHICLLYIFASLAIGSLAKNDDKSGQGNSKNQSPHLPPPSSMPTISHIPSSIPSSNPTGVPTELLSLSPSSEPLQEPSIYPSSVPSKNPSTLSSSMPSNHPSNLPTSLPTRSNTPSTSPSLNPTKFPSSSPVPTKHPSIEPTLEPTMTPPSPLPSGKPSSFPSYLPTKYKKRKDKPPTKPPSLGPTLEASNDPSSTPTNSPSSSPTLNPTSSPSSIPISSPTPRPSLTPTDAPTNSPTSSPSSIPTSSPTSHPSLTPTLSPSSSPTSFPTDAPTAKRPNLIMVLTDEHNYRTLSCYRDYLASKIGAGKVDVWGDATRLDTPNIDKLAKQGALFTNFYTVAPLCTPSRASFMTGLYPSSTGGSELNHGAMNSKLKTFASVLQEERRYRTGYFGKWHLDGEEVPGWGANGRSFGFDSNKYRWNRGHFKFLDEVNGSMRGYEIDQVDLISGKQEEHYTTDYLVDRGIEFMKRAVENSKQFAMVLSIPDPHGPNQNRWKYRNMFNDRYFKAPHTAETGMSLNPAAPGWNHFDLEDVPLDEVDEYIEEYEASEYWQNHMQQYYGMVKCIDDNVGKLMKSIKDAGVDEDTIVVFTSDHGDLLFEHGKFNKGSPYDTSAGVPFLIRYPGQIAAGKVVKTAYSSVDFAPTILSLMGVKDAGVDFQGADGSEEWLDDALVSNDKSKIIISMDSGKTPVWAMAQLSNYKLVVSKGETPWLFDLKSDPEEIYNYIDSAQHQAIKRKLQYGIVRAMKKYNIPLLWYSRSIFIDKPVCYDKKDILPITNGKLAQCKDIGGIVSADKCEAQEKVRLHCPVTCESCCVDTDGIIAVEGTFFWSCDAAKAAGKCKVAKVQEFCPVTCKQCR